MLIISPQQTLAKDIHRVLFIALVVVVQSLLQDVYKRQAAGSARCSSASGHEAVKYSEAMKDA